MRKKLMKQVMTLAAAWLILTPVLAFSTPVFAVTADDADSLLWGNQQDNIDTNIGLGNQDPRIIVAKVINVILGFLGIIAVVIILLGGFKWMTAGGNEDKTGEAKKLIAAGAVGLVIILAAWGIATFVIGALYNATTGA